jgi:hypothetical protein
MLNLKHQSLYAADGALVDEYRPRFIMGSGDIGTPGGRWGVGTSTGRDSFDGSIDRDGALQDDVGTLVGKGLTIRSDDHGDVRSAATAMTLASFGFTAGGVIERETDVDFFRFSGVTPGTHVSFAVRGNPLAPMFDARLEVYDAAGTLLAAAETADQYDESLSIPSSVSTAYYVAVRAAANPSDEYNVGQYRLDVGLGSSDDDNVSLATPLSGIEENDAAVSAGLPGLVVGRQEASGFLSTLDRWDWYAFQAGPNHEARIVLSGLTANANLHVYRPEDVLFDTPVFSSTNGGTLSETGLVGRERTPRGRSNPFLIGVELVSGAATGYRLSVTTDEAGHAFGYGGVLRGDLSGVEYYGHVGPGDEDGWRADIGWGTALRTVYAAHGTFSVYTGNARLSLGYDLNGDGRLEGDEVAQTSVASPGLDVAIANVPLANAGGTPLRMLIEDFASSSTNYRLSVRPEVYRPTLAFDLRELGIEGRDLSLTRHGIQLLDELDDGAPLNVIELPAPAAGGMELQITPGNQAAVNYFLVRDANDNGNVDQGEIVAAGSSLKFTAPAGDASRYYFVASLNPQSSVRTAPYELFYRDAIAADGSSANFKTPKTLPLGSQVPVLGFVVNDPQGPFHRRANYYRLTAPQDGQAGIDVAFSSPAPGNGRQQEVQLVLGQDRNQDGLLDPAERILTRVKGEGSALTLDAVLGKGTYLAAVELVGGEAAIDEPFGWDYALSTRFQQPLDTTPVVVNSTQVLHLNGASGVKLGFSEDVRASLAHGEIVLRTLEKLPRTLEPLVQSYDEQSQSLLLILDPNDTRGPYAVEIAAGTIADPVGNFLQKPLAMIVYPGDFDGNAQVDGVDLAQSAVGWNKRFGGDLNGRDLLVWQRNFGAAPVSLALAEGDSEAAVVAFAVADAADRPLAGVDGWTAQFATDALARSAPRRLRTRPLPRDPGWRGDAAVDDAFAASRRSAAGRSVAEKLPAAERIARPTEMRRGRAAADLQAPGEADLTEAAADAAFAAWSGSRSAALAGR